MNNSVFGNTMENIRKRVDIRLVSGGEIGEKKVEKLAAKPSFEGCRSFIRILWPCICIKHHWFLTSLSIWGCTSWISAKPSCTIPITGTPSQNTVIRPSYCLPLPIPSLMRLRPMIFFADIWDDVYELFDRLHHPVLPSSSTWSEEFWRRAQNVRKFWLFLSWNVTVGSKYLMWC